MAREKSGWVKIDGARKWHYVHGDGRSLCRRWLYLGSVEPEQGNDESSSNCPGCMKALTKAKAKAIALATST